MMFNYFSLIYTSFYSRGTRIHLLHFCTEWTSVPLNLIQLLIPRT